MQLSFSNIKISKPEKSIGNLLKSIKDIKYKNPYFIEIIDYAMSLLKQEDLDFKIEVLISLFKEGKMATELIEEFEKSSRLLRALYDLTSIGLISDKKIGFKIPGKYPENKYNFDLKMFIYKMRKNLINKKQILLNENELFENEILFQCQYCKNTYNYIDAMALNFKCCDKFLGELNKDSILEEISEKINTIDTKLEVLNKL